MNTAPRPRDARRPVLALGLAAAGAAGAVAAVAAPPAWSRDTAVVAAMSPVVAGPTGRYNVGAAHSPELFRMLASPSAATLGPRTAGQTVSYLRGIDVSSQQHAHGATIGWAKVAGAGYKFAFVKATEGSYYVNPFYAGDIAAARRAGLLTAAYAFAIPNDSSATLQADLALNAAGNLTDGGRTLPLIVDIEYDPYVSLDHTNYCYGLSNAAMVAWITAFTAEVQRRTGTPPVIYTLEPWWHLCTGDSTTFGADPLWVASGGTSPKLPPGWATWEYWQYTSSAAVPGVAGKTDVSYFSAANPDAATPATQSDAAGSAVTLPVHALDTAAGQPLTWAATGLPAGMAISPTAGRVTGTLPATPASYPVTITATDAASDTQTLRFTWQVHGPVTLTWPGRQSSGAGGAVSLQIRARDRLAGCSLSFTATGLPPGLAISPCGRITGWATRPGQYRVAIRVAGSAGATLASTTFPWTVRPPSALATGRLRLAIADMCLAVPAGQTARIWTCRRSAGQTWQVAQNGTIRIGGHCLAELSPTSTAPALRPCTSLLGQIWQQTEAGALANAQSGQCLTDPGASRKDGTAVTLAGCDDTQRQAWTLPPAPLSVGLGQCVAGTIASGGNPATLSLARCAPARRAGQAWTVASDGTISMPGGCLTTAGTTAIAGTPVTLTACPAPTTKNFPAQQWRPMPRLGGPAGPGGPASTGSFLVNPATGLCLAVPAQPPAGSALALGYCLAGYPSLTWHIG